MNIQIHIIPVFIACCLLLHHFFLNASNNPVYFIVHRVIIIPILCSMNINTSIFIFSHLKNNRFHVAADAHSRAPQQGGWKTTVELVTGCWGANQFIGGIRRQRCADSKWRNHRQEFCRVIRQCWRFRTACPPKRNAWRMRERNGVFVTKDQGIHSEALILEAISGRLQMRELQLIIMSSGELYKIVYI